MKDKKKTETSFNATEYLIKKDLVAISTALREACYRDGGQLDEITMLGIQSLLDRIEENVLAG